MQNYWFVREAGKTPDFHFDSLSFTYEYQLINACLTIPVAGGTPPFHFDS
jgi:hypothetical protein